MTAREFKKANHYRRCTHAYVVCGQTCVGCRNHRVTFETVWFYDSRGSECCRNEKQLWCHACGFRGFRTDIYRTCDAWEG